MKSPRPQPPALLRKLRQEWRSKFSRMFRRPPPWRPFNLPALLAAVLLSAHSKPESQCVSQVLAPHELAAIKCCPKGGTSMRHKVIQVLVLSAYLLLLADVAHTQDLKPLAGVKTVQVDQTVVPKADRVKEEHAANQVADSLRN